MPFLQILLITDRFTKDDLLNNLSQDDIIGMDVKDELLRQHKVSFAC
jgi:hypothetical protein